MNQPIFLQPVFQERIWGGTKLKELFQYDIPSERVRRRLAKVVTASRNRVSPA